MLIKTIKNKEEEISKNPFKRKFAIVMPFVLITSTFLVFQLYVRLVGPGLAWYLGLMTYWLTWCLVFSLWIIGKKRVRELVRPQKPDKIIVVLVLVPMLLAGIWRFVAGMSYPKESIWIVFGLVMTSFGNGIFEELLWRGVYMELFPKNNWYRIGWSTLWFSLWHFVPGSISSNSGVIGLVLGSAFFGIYLSLLAKKTGTIWWSIIAHILGGLVIIA